MTTCGDDRDLGLLENKLDGIIRNRPSSGPKSIGWTCGKPAGEHQRQYEELLSKNQDADMAEVIMELKMQENVYRASLSAGARIIMPSLVDFLR